MYVQGRLSGMGLMLKSDPIVVIRQLGQAHFAV